MNKDLKMLLISVVSLIIVLIFVNALDNQNKNCKTVEYQNLLTGPYTERVCEWEK